MRPPQKHCPNCGARVLRPGSQRACDYCGNELELGSPPRTIEREQRFARLKSAPDLSNLLAQPVGGGGQLFGAFLGLVVSGSIVVVGVLIATLAVPMSGPFAIVPILVVGIAILGFVKILRQTARFARDPGSARPALVVDERVRVQDGGDGPSRTRNYATLEDEGGQRRELETTDEVAGRIAPGDAGVAYERGGFLVHFVRVEA
ncbi:MAG: hypothetical protein NTY35_15355 [Planctomycetota bacterium]|nr:hypothetical protein [Planctomycetota bacterium]